MARTEGGGGRGARGGQERQAAGVRLPPQRPPKGHVNARDKPSGPWVSRPAGSRRAPRARSCRTVMEGGAARRKARIDSEGSRGVLAACGPPFGRSSRGRSVPPRAPRVRSPGDHCGPQRRGDHHRPPGGREDPPLSLPRRPRRRRPLGRPLGLPPRLPHGPPPTRPQRKRRWRPSYARARGAAASASRYSRLGEAVAACVPEGLGRPGAVSWQGASGTPARPSPRPPGSRAPRPPARCRRSPVPRSRSDRLRAAPGPPSRP